MVELTSLLYFPHSDTNPTPRNYLKFYRRTLIKLSRSKSVNLDSPKWKGVLFITVRILHYGSTFSSSLRKEANQRPDRKQWKAKYEVDIEINQLFVVRQGLIS